MTTGELWWNRLVNSARFLDDIQDTLTDNKSVILFFNTIIPWQEIMIEAIGRRIADNTHEMTFDILDVSKVTEPALYLIDKYCSKDEQNKYWPTTHGTPENFLAHSKVTSMNRRYIFLKGINTKNALKWTESVTKYLAGCEADSEHGIFIIMLENINVPVSRHLTAFRYEDYITDYDCMMLCLTLVSDMKCSRTEKMYLCEVASNIANNNVELASMLAKNQTALLKNPHNITKQVFTENNVKGTNLKERVRTAVWKAQIKLVFPKLENFRAELIRKYEQKLSFYLPIESSNNDIIENPSHLEIGQLYFICKANGTQKIVSISEYEMLRKMREARNTLAHWEPLSYEQLTDINVF
ncbi:MAG: hypothetical protein K2G36_11035 [Ruminococcus sp.]|nr:hypothetical protein [Ruminococcus sp.]